MLRFRTHLSAISVNPVGAYAAILAAGAAFLVAWLMVAGYELGPAWALLGLGCLGAIGERGRIRFTSNIELSISLLPTLFIAIVFGPLAAMVVAAFGMLGDFRRPYMRWAIYTLSESITAAIAGLAAAEAALLSSSGMGSIVIATFVGAVTAQALDLAFACVTLKLRNGNPTVIVKMVGPPLAASIPLYTSVVALLAFTYKEVSPWTLPLFLVPAFTAQRLFMLYQRQRGLAESLAAANTQLERANLSFATGLIATLDARDRYTAGHSAAVAIYARDIAARMGLSDRAQHLAHLCGLVHDIGKVGLPAGLLEKPGPLSLEERRQMEEHCVIGERILEKVDDYAEIASIVRHHHERVDGRGYPDGLLGSAIPMISRIIAVADAYNAMTSHRPYRQAMPSRVARLRLAQAVESQFDTSVVAAFEAILAGATETYRLGSQSDFRLESTREDELGGSGEKAA